MMVCAREIMTRAVVTVTPETPLEAARSLLTSHHVSALPVVDEAHHLVGIVTTWDLLRARSNDPAARTVGAVMTSGPLWMSAGADVRVVARRLRHYGPWRAMPIVEHGVLVGIVTRGDLVRRPVRGGLLARVRHLFDRTPPERDDREPRRRADRYGDDEPRRGTRVAEVMTPRDDLVVAREHTSADEVRPLLADNRLTAVPVIDDDDHVVGMIGEADLVPTGLSGRREPHPRTVGDAMTVGAIAVRDEVELEKAARAMVEQRLRLLPVVDHDDRLAGVVSRGDLLRALPAAEPAT
ncbi:MAG TPA: CBS domain-containing protein, partial [Actinomycetospora sp.]|uniref:CBS domain-containing protein n=1 Tax=Actinomycetospora sp. TaxID=1872135 RepID=UPI002F40AA13